MHSMYSQSHVEFGPPLRVIDLMASASVSHLQESQIILTILLAVYPIILSRINHLRDGNLCEDFKERFITPCFRRGLPALTAGIRQSSRCPGPQRIYRAPIDGGAGRAELFKQLTISQAVDEVHRQEESVSQHTGQGPVCSSRSFSTAASGQ